MKKLLAVLAISILTLSCKNSTEKKNEFENEIQTKFDKLLNSKINQEYEATNDIQKKDFFLKYDKDLVSFIDSNKVFIGWQAKIEDIRTNDFEKSTEVSCKLSYKPNDNREVSFYCSYIVEKSKMNTDSLYNRIKRIGDFSTVYFDGFIVKNIENKIMYTTEDEMLKTSYPNFKFNLLNISEKKIEKKLSENLSIAIETNFKVFELLKQKVNKTISEKEWKRKTNNLGLEKMEKNLNAEEKQYSDKIKQYLVSDFMYQ